MITALPILPFSHFSFNMNPSHVKGVVTLSNLPAKFQTDMELRNFSPNTRRLYLSHLKRFAEYGPLFRAASENLLELAGNPKYLGAKIGLITVLHTWGQNLMDYPHLHCVVPGGGLTPEGYWRRSRKKFFIPVKVLSRKFRGKFLALLCVRFPRLLTVLCWILTCCCRYKELLTTKS